MERKNENLQAEHGVDSGARGVGRWRSAFKRRNRRLLGGWRRSRRLLHGRLMRNGRRSRRRTTGSWNARGSSGWLGSNLLEIGEIARFFRARLNGGKRQIHLMLHCAGDAVQLPDELFELFRTAKVQVAVPQKADGQHDENRQADGQCGEYAAEEQRVEGCEGLGQWRLQMQASEPGYSSAAVVTNESISGQAVKRSQLFFGSCH
jgi:hypothetical protein